MKDLGFNLVSLLFVKVILISDDRLKNVFVLMIVILLFFNCKVWSFGRYFLENVNGDNDVILLFCNCNLIRWGKV